MGSTFDATAAAPILKVRYTDKKLRTLFYNKQPFLGMVAKKTDCGGANFVVPLRIGAPQTRGATFPGAIASATNAGSASKYSRFTCDYYNDYATANIDGERIDRTKGDSNAFVEAITSEVDGALMTLKRSIGISLYRNGGGARGVISSGSTIASPTITLATPQDITNFEVGMPLQAAASDGTSGSPRVTAASPLIVGVDRDLGTITLAQNWSTIFTSLAVGDSLFFQGDFGAMPQGIAAWCPSTAPTSTAFNGLDRTADVTRLGGVRFAGNGAPYEETLIEAAARLDREGSEPDAVFMNPLNFSQLVKAMGSKVVLERLGHASDEPTIGFSGVKLLGVGGEGISVYADVNCPYGTAYMLQMDTWRIISMGDVPRIAEVDGNRLLRLAGADAYEVRMLARYNLTCNAPGWNAAITL